jgi:hypothetical protein
MAPLLCRVRFRALRHVRCLDQQRGYDGVPAVWLQIAEDHRCR